MFQEQQKKPNQYQEQTKFFVLLSGIMSEYILFSLFFTAAGLVEYLALISLVVSQSVRDVV